MLRLRLFRRENLASQLDSRTLDEGEMSLGRDAKADWAVDDPDRAISRRHLSISNHGGLLTVRDTSSNGVFLGEPRQRIERDRATPVSLGEPIHFGNFVLVIEEDEGRHGGAGPAFASGRTEPSPFEGFDRPEPAAAQARSAQPFASTLKADPLSGDGAIADSDAWERRPETAAGSWDAANPAKRTEHTKLIGAERQWSEPPPQPAAEGYGFDAPFSRPILQQPVVPTNAAAIPSDWMEPRTDAPPPAIEPIPEAAVTPPPADLPADPILPPSRPAEPPRVAAAAEPDDQGLFDWFCAGAGLKPAMFAGEPPQQVMERLGATYRQAVLGIADLMQERTALKNEYRMAHTSVRPDGNNPFKWVPPQRIAIELLRDEGGGYTTGARALGDALHDIKAHLLCMLAGMRAALNTTFEALAPDRVEERVAGRAYLMKTQRDAALWAEFVEMSDQLRGEADDSVDGPINRAFRAAYEAQAAALDAARGRG